MCAVVRWLHCLLVVVVVVACFQCALCMLTWFFRVVGPFV